MKRGFTLIELLAVIVILAVIALIAVPIVINIINDAKKSSQEESIKMYGKAVEDAVANYLLKNPNDKDITLDKIKDYINYNGEKIECGIVQIFEGKIYLNECKVGNTSIDYQYGSLQVSKPEINNGLTPVIYDGENWKIVSESDKDWYDYDNQKWANAVVLKSGSTKTVGDIVTVEGEDPDALMMYVWIPRYEYKIEGDYGKGGTSAESPGEIEVNFISKSTTTATKDYHIHPAFTFGDKEENGFWVGKFELSHTELSSNAKTNNLGCTNGESGVTCTVDSTKFRILPNVEALRKNNVSNFWYGIKSIENTSSFGLTNIDIHMIKNSEWGAVAYLSQSRYGKYGNSDYEGDQKEIYQNKSNDYITGSSNGTPSQETSYTQCTYNQKIGTSENQDQNNCGLGASTTGNIYGVYDLSGGSWEYVMGAYGTEIDGIYSGYNMLNNSGFNGKTGFDSGIVTNGLSLIASKYYDFYKTNDATTACNNGTCYGHALLETENWYVDSSNMVSSWHPWIVRGGYYYENLAAGIFHSLQYYGHGNERSSTRVVGFKE